MGECERHCQLWCLIIMKQLTILKEGQLKTTGIIKPGRVLLTGLSKSLVAGFKFMA